MGLKKNKLNKEMSFNRKDQKSYILPIRENKRGTREKPKTVRGAKEAERQNQ